MIVFGSVEIQESFLSFPKQKQLCF
jgi:hypothetical protein